MEGNTSTASDQTRPSLDDEYSTRCPSWSSLNLRSIGGSIGDDAGDDVSNADGHAVEAAEGSEVGMALVAAACDLEGVAVCTLVGQSMSIGVSPNVSVTAGKRCWVHSNESLVQSYSHYHVQYTLCSVMATCPRHQGGQWHA